MHFQVCVCDSITEISICAHVMYTKLRYWDNELSLSSNNLRFGLTMRYTSGFFMLVAYIVPIKLKKWLIKKCFKLIC